jgi:hypothetical protein
MSAGNTTRFDYEQMVQAALRGVVRSVLEDVSKHGLLGNHHFYIAFRTDYPGVHVPDHLRERYPEEITIVIQHQYWNLRVMDDHFEVQLSFNKRPENLVVPFGALSGFMDPSVQFGLQLQPLPAPVEAQDTLPDPGPEPDDEEETAAAPATEPAATADGGNVVALDVFRKNAKP